jgi:two-component system chemotaxis response regulator CheY
MNILVVDDSATVRAMLARALRISGYRGSRILEASNGKEALEKLKEGGADIVFSDIRMPVMDGFNLLREMCRDNKLKAIPVVAMSADAPAAMETRPEGRLMRAYLRKPFTPEQIRDLMRGVAGGGNG